MLCGGCSDVDAKDAFCVPWVVSISNDCSIFLLDCWTWISRLLTNLLQHSEANRRWNSWARNTRIEEDVFDATQKENRIWPCKECEGVRNALWGLFWCASEGCTLRAMDGFRIKGLQHILVNVSVYLDLNFQTTVMVTNDFAPAIRGKQQMELGGTRSSKTDAYVTSMGASCNTKHERHSSQKKGLCKKDVAPPQLVGTLYTLDPWNIGPDFTPCYQLELMTLFLLALSMVEKQVLTFPFIKGNVIYKKDALKLVPFVCE